MAKKLFTNTASCTIGGKKPGETFALEVFDDGKTPAELFWRKRLNEGVLILASASTPDSDKKAARKAAADKGN